LNDDMAAELIEVLKEIRDNIECHTKVVSKGIHILRNEARELRKEEDDGTGLRDM